MRGGQVFMEGLIAHGTECIFGNPGTTENSVLDRLIDYPQLSYYIALHEGIAVGAANYYAQATGKTGIANLHVAPGLGNAIGMMYGALKAHSPIIVTAGQQDTRMRLRDPILGHDLVSMASPVTKWSAQPTTADELSPLIRKAFKIANDPPRGPVFLALPVNILEQETNISAETTGNVLGANTPDPRGISQLCQMILNSKSPAIVVGDDIVIDGAHKALIAMAEKIGSAVFSQGLHVHSAFPNQHVQFIQRLPFEAANINKIMSNFDLIILLGGPFFEEIWYDTESFIPSTSKIAQIESSHQRLGNNIKLDIGLVGNLGLTIQAIIEVLDKTEDKGFQQASTIRRKKLAENKEERRLLIQERLASHADGSPMTPANVVDAISKAITEDTIVVDESITASLEVANQMNFKNPGDFFGAAGGGIGQGIAGAIGIQVAKPDRKVLAISGDGSAMYSIQAFWSAAHHQLPIVFLILVNREYRILKHNIDIYRARYDAPSNKPYPHMDLTNPVLSFVQLAEGMGVQGKIVEELIDIPKAIQSAFEQRKPCVIEVLVSGKR